MPVDTSSYGLAPSASPVDSFLRAMQGVQQIRGQQEAQRALIDERKAQTAEIARKTAEAQRAAFEEKTLTELFGSGQPIDPKAVYSVVGPKRGADILKGIAGLQEQNIKTEDALRSHVGTMVGGIKALPENMRPAAYARVRGDFIQKGFSKPEDLPEQYSPEILDVAQKWALTPKEQLEQQAAAARDKINADKAAAELPGITADAAVKAQVAAGTVGGITPEQRAQNANAAGQLAVARARETREAAAAKAAQGDVTELTPEGLDAAATMFAKTGQLPALGMGDKQTRKKIINRAAVMIPGLDIASAKADYGANTASLQNVTKTLDTLTAFENTAGKNLDQFLNLASKVPDTGVPWLNKPIRSINASALGSADQAAFDAARVVALREIARVTNDPKLSGVLSDSARKEVSDLSPETATFAQIRAVAKTLKTDMANVHSSLNDQREAITGRLRSAGGGGNVPVPPAPAPAPNATGIVEMTAPDGRRLHVPASDVQRLLGLGAKKVG